MLLIVIDIFSRRAFTEAVKSKTSQAVLAKIFWRYQFQIDLIDSQNLSQWNDG